MFITEEAAKVRPINAMRVQLRGRKHDLSDPRDEVIVSDEIGVERGTHSGDEEDPEIEVEIVNEGSAEKFADGDCACECGELAEWVAPHVGCGGVVEKEDIKI